MSQKFISLDDAATRLGVSKDRLNQLREGGDLRAYRDGASWKFRSEDIEKLESEGVPSPGADELTLADPVGGAADDDIGLGVEPLGEGDDAESILLTGDQEPDGGIPRPQSTIIGKSELSLDDDLQIASDSDLGSTGKNAGADLVGGQSASAEDVSGATSASFEGIDELELDLEEESGSLMGSGSGSGPAASASAESIEGAASASLEFDELELDLAGGSDLESGSDVLTGQESRIGMDNASLSGAGSVAGLSGIDSVQLSVDEDDDLVLGGEDSSKSGVSDSGIDLSPSDSGFALDEVPLDLGGSAIGSALDLASLSAVSGIGADKPAAMSSASGGEGDFQLTPAESGDEEEDSSQIVALEDVGDEDEDLPGFEAADDAADAAPFAAMEADGAASAAPAAVGAAQETPFPGWVIGLLGAGFLSMMLAGVMAMDLLQTMWAWEEPYAISSSLMEGLLSIGGE